MKTRSFAIILVGLCAFAQASDLRSEINAMGKQIAQEMKTKDFKALDKTMRAGITSDFTYMENGQKENYDQMLQQMKAGIGMVKKFNEASASVVSLKEKGNTAICSMKHTMSGVTTGQDKKNHTISFTGISEDTYVKVGGKWKMSKMSWKSQKMSMDGKPMPSGAAS